VTLPFGEEVTVTRQIQGLHGDKTDGASHHVEGCAVWNGATTETINGVDIVVWSLMVLMPPGTDVLPTDTVTVRGTVYRVTGEPALFQSPLTGTMSGIQVILQSATG
jgi:hypothetical protein